MKNCLLALFLFLLVFPFLLFSQVVSWNSSSTNYATSYNFDANGNISSINRNAYGSNDVMDKLTFYYNTAKNQLNYVTDEENVKFTTDLNTQTSNNYEYDKLGRLIKDVANGINKIEYTIFNKPYKIYKNNGDVIQYMYDSSSNKVAQKVTNSTAEKSIIYYTLTNAAQINGVYCSDGSNVTLAESHISDLVTLTRNENIKTPRISSKVFTRLIHYKNYPLHDHLGSVRVVLSDKKESETEVSIIEESTYYPYGMQVPGMSYQTENSRFGFQGKEVLTAMTAAGGSHLDFGARINDVRIAQWTSVDPLEAKFPSLSPYNSMGNNPILNIDLDGNEYTAFTKSIDKSGNITYSMKLLVAINVDPEERAKLRDSYNGRQPNDALIKEMVETELEDTYTGGATQSVPQADGSYKTISINWVMEADVVVVADPSQAPDDATMIRFGSSKFLTYFDASAIGNPFTDNIQVQSGSLDVMLAEHAEGRNQTGPGSLTISHEVGHTSGLSHTHNDLRYIYWGEEVCTDGQSHTYDPMSYFDCDGDRSDNHFYGNQFYFGIDQVDEMWKENSTGYTNNSKPPVDISQIPDAPSGPQKRGAY